MFIPNDAAAKNSVKPDLFGAAIYYDRRVDRYVEML